MKITQQEYQKLLKQIQRKYPEQVSILRHGNMAGNMNEYHHVQKGGPEHLHMNGLCLFTSHLGEAEHYVIFVHNAHLIHPQLREAITSKNGEWVWKTGRQLSEFFTHQEEFHWEKGPDFDAERGLHLTCKVSEFQYNIIKEKNGKSSTYLIEVTSQDGGEVHSEIHLSLKSAKAFAQEFMQPDTLKEDLANLRAAYTIPSTADHNPSITSS